MSIHDTWVKLSPASPYDRIMHLFPRDIPMRDPFSMAVSADIDPVTGSPAALWIVDMERLTGEQLEALAATIATGCNASIDDVVNEAMQNGGFTIRYEWIIDMEGGPECFRRTQELADFLETAPERGTLAASIAWYEFVADQQRRWIDGDEVPPPLPERIEDFDPRMRTPELKEALIARRINKMLAEKGYSVLDALTGKATADIMRELDPDHEYSIENP
jgi:hypothetical protein